MKKKKILRKNLMEIINNFLVNKREKNELTEEDYKTKSFEELGIDDLDQVEIVLEIEEKLKLKLEDPDVFYKLDDLVEYISLRKN